MGRSTVSQLILRAKNQNEYDNSGVSSDTVWIDHFNSALNKLAEDIKLDNYTTIEFVPGTEDYELPDDFFGLIIVNDDRNSRVSKRRHFDQQYPPGYWVINRGDKWILNLRGYTAPMTFTVYYYRYASMLSLEQKDTQKPEIPTAGEDALIYKAISNALKNNNQIGKAQYFDELYKEEMARINNANDRARG